MPWFGFVAGGTGVVVMNIMAIRSAVVVVGIATLFDNATVGAGVGTSHAVAAFGR